MMFSKQSGIGTTGCMGKRGGIGYNEVAVNDIWLSKNNTFLMKMRHTQMLRGLFSQYPFKAGILPPKKIIHVKSSQILDAVKSLQTFETEVTDYVVERFPDSSEISITPLKQDTPVRTILQCAEPPRSSHQSLLTSESPY